MTVKDDLAEYDSIQAEIAQQLDYMKNHRTVGYYEYIEELEDSLRFPMESSVEAVKKIMALIDRPNHPSAYRSIDRDAVPEPVIFISDIKRILEES